MQLALVLSPQNQLTCNDLLFLKCPIINQTPRKGLVGDPTGHSSFGLLHIAKQFEWHCHFATAVDMEMKDTLHSLRSCAKKETSLETPHMCSQFERASCRSIISNETAATTRSPHEQAVGSDPALAKLSTSGCYAPYAL